MSTEELMIGEVSVLFECVELLARRRAAGELTPLYPEVIMAADSITCLRGEAPTFLQPDLADLQSRCSILLRSIAN